MGGFCIQEARLTCVCVFRPAPTPGIRAKSARNGGRGSAKYGQTILGIRWLSKSMWGAGSAPSKSPGRNSNMTSKMHSEGPPRRLYVLCTPTGPPKPRRGLPGGSLMSRELRARVQFPSIFGRCIICQPMSRLHFGCSRIFRFLS